LRASLKGVRERACDDRRGLRGSLKGEKGERERERESMSRHEWFEGW
jgi:hypothetical protein